MLSPRQRILDVGCGDGFIVSQLFLGGTTNSISAIDLHLTDQQRDLLSRRYPGVAFHNTYDVLKKSSYDIITLLDVLEHVKDDEGFLATVMGYLKPDRYLLVTVPAFNWLFSGHDRFLHHYRRYSASELTSLLQRQNLEVVNSGFLFSLLLPPRFLSCALERIGGGRKNYVGVGNWHHGSLLTQFIAMVLNITNNITLYINRFGVKTPGLSVWALCRKPR